MASRYDAIRSSVVSSGTDSRVEVNQRALIDKILARYASAGAVYRELIQNSNDAEANTAEIRFTTSDTPTGRLVTQVVYRNNGHPFRPQDWERLRKIAEGNPDVSKVGAFGVGAYTMFSICEEPLVVSGNEALAFAWKGDALWTKTGPAPHTPDQWTTFVLPSRDLYPVPNLVEFGQFLCTSLTFTQCLHTIIVYIDEKDRLTISKRQLQPPKVITPPKASSFWSNDGAITHSPNKIFSLGRTDGSITETTIEMTATLDGDVSSITARYVSALANVRVPQNMAKQMYRVTKKKPPTEVNIQIFIDAAAKKVNRKNSRAGEITDKFSPGMGNGGVFIGFKTSQTTGLAAHLAAPLIPTVEREAIDFQNPTLKVYNSELLSIAGILMRLTLEHSMSLIDKRWEETKEERMALEKRLREGGNNPKNDFATEKPRDDYNQQQQTADPENSKSRGALFGFASFMSSGVRRIADVISAVDFRGNDEEDLLNPEDPRPLSKEEEEAILLMCSFCPQQSTPDPHVGSLIAKGFASCMLNVSPPVLTRSGVVRSSESRLPFHGIERFVNEGVVRRVVQQSADAYFMYVAGCQSLSLSDLEGALQKKPLSEEDLIIFLKWWAKFCRVQIEAYKRGPAIKAKISFIRTNAVTDGKDEDRSGIVSLGTILHYRDERMFSNELPMPPTLLPQSIQEKVTQKVLGEPALSSLFSALPFEIWASFISTHPCLTAGRHVDADVRLLVLSALSKKHSSKTGPARVSYESWLQKSLSNIRCIPYHSYVPQQLATDFPRDLYLSSAEIAVFEGLGSFVKVSPALQKAGISDEFLVVLGVRKAISIDFLFTQLDNLKWSGDPQPLIAYLSKATLTAQDLHKLRNTKYLPASGDKSTAYAPSELHLPHPQLALFPFLKTIHWPSTDELTERSPEGRFLKQLGCRVDPELRKVLNYLTQETMDDITRLKILSFVSERLRPSGPYGKEYASLPFSGPSSFRQMKFLPTIRKDPLKAENPRTELQAPEQCYTDSEALCMGFSVLDPSLQKKEGKSAGERFLCKPRPLPNRIVYQLLNIVSFAKSKQAKLAESNKEFSDVIIASFSNIFDYLSTRTKEFDEAMLRTMREAPFIPCMQEGKLGWFRPGELYFKNANSDTAELTSALFCVTNFNPFLAAIGVQSEPSLKDLFHLVITSPRLVLDKVGGEAKYLALLRRIAVNPPYTKVTAEMKNSAFLLAYRMEEGKSQESENYHEQRDEVRKFVLAKAGDISVIDNSFFARMFNALSAPPESDLESFYVSLGSEYISKLVQQRFQYVGTPLKNTSLTTAFMARVQERKPLLVSPNVTSRKFRRNAAALLDEKNLDIYEVGGVRAIYRLENMTRIQDITCFAADGINRSRKGSVYIAQNFDWFDAGGAIGKIILQRCHLEDSFFIASLLEAPLKQLRARGFPVDRVLKDAEPAVQSREEPKGTGTGSISKENGICDDLNGSRDSPGATASSGGTERDGFINILTQMFPDCDREHLQSLLGKVPTLETLRQAADSLADGNYPKQERVQEKTQPPQNTNTSAQTSDSLSSAEPTEPQQNQNENPRSTRGIRSNPFSRALRGIKRPSVAPGRKAVVREGSSSKPVPPTHDIRNQKNLEQVLRDSVRSSRKVPSAGVSSRETLLTSIPEDLERGGDNCEVLPAHSLKPYPGRDLTGKTRNGIRLFSSRRDSISDQYISRNIDAVEAFSNILQTLCEVYSLRLHSVAIFHESDSSTIAFNSGSALYFNLRFFASLHWSSNTLDERCYSYWFTTMAHELAHNFVSPHNKQHGYFTQSYVKLFLPKLLDVLR